MARRLRKEIAEVFGHTAEIQVRHRRRPAQGHPLPGAGEQGRRGAGPAGRPGRPARPAGPRPAAARSWPARLADAEAAWRGAFLAHGSLTEPGRAGALEITCPGQRGGAGPGRRRPPARHPGQGPRGARRRPGGGPRRRRDRRAADPARRARLGAGLGGAPDAPRGAGHRQPAGQLRRRQPAPLGPGRGGRRRPGRAGDGHPRRRTPPSTCCRPAGCGWSTSRPRWRSWAACPTRR